MIRECAAWAEETTPRSTRRSRREREGRPVVREDPRSTAYSMTPCTRAIPRTSQVRRMSADGARMTRRPPEGRRSAPRKERHRRRAARRRCADRRGTVPSLRVTGVSPLPVVTTPRKPRRLSPPPDPRSGIGWRSERLTRQVCRRPRPNAPRAGRTRQREPSRPGSARRRWRGSNP